MAPRIIKPNSYWQSKLTPEQYRVLRLKGTEPPSTGEYDQHFEKGTYRCAACGQKLFASNHKYDAGCGWPSFWEAVDHKNLEFVEDSGHDMHRTEVLCRNCGGHLGHIFDDGPKDKTGLRYCINSLALKFIPH